MGKAERKYYDFFNFDKALEALAFEVGMSVEEFKKLSVQEAAALLNV